MNPNLLLRWAVVATVASLSACGGGGGNSIAPPPPPGSDRGTIQSASVAGTLSAAQIDASVASAEAPLVGAGAKCPVKVVKLVYATIDPKGAVATASAGLLVPDGSGCAGPYPLLSQQHGTNTFSGFSQTSTSDGSVQSAAAMFASQGIVTVLPDYLGYGNSSIAYHPYLQLENSAAVVIDALRAARHWLAGNGVVLDGKVFLSGTSEGGYATLATQKVIERENASEFALAAVGAGSGPYQLSQTVAQFMATPDSPDSSKTVYGSMIIVGLQKTYGDLYGNPVEIFNAQWSGGIEAASPGQYSETQLYNNCIEPFNLKDPWTTGFPVFGSCSTLPLLQGGFVTDFLNGTSLYNGSALALRTRLVAQDLLTGWTPVAPLGLCYGAPDTMAAPNAVLAQSYFTGRGFQKLTMEEIDSDTTEPIKTWVATQEPLHPAGSGYHGKVEGPACLSWIRHNVIDPKR